eukprot:754163-Hanusia_phi.AAC.1
MLLSGRPSSHLLNVTSPLSLGWLCVTIMEHVSGLSLGLHDNGSSILQQPPVVAAHVMGYRGLGAGQRPL